LNEIVLASGNAGKLAEMRAVLAPLGVTLRSQTEFDVPQACETGVTFVENALIKARNAAYHTGFPALADDSGLIVAALDGAPGVRSARFAGERARDADNLSLLLEKLAGVPDERRDAYFFCVLVLLTHAEDPTPLICEGRWKGRILIEPRGQGGFGYDPVFFIPELDATAAELSLADKNRLSHRGRALDALTARLHWK
jgi:XTP/dITP diphosphohydrolase